MKILALNSGSSSIKYRIYDSSHNFQLLRAESTERIGQQSSSDVQSSDHRPNQEMGIPFPDYRMAMYSLFSRSDLSGIDAIGHRVVHGGERFKGPTLINNDVIEEIVTLAKFAPLHCQLNVVGIKVLQELLPAVPHVAVFDTAAHAAMEFKALLYGLPMDYYKNHQIRRYGFHGINHSYVASEAARLLNKPLEKLKIITCHLGNGCSITAFKNGKSTDNSMGMTPLEGLVMGTRCGDLDPSIVIYLIEELGLTTTQVTELLNKKSGLLGLCGSGDMRDIIVKAKSNDRSSQLAIEIFVYRIQKYIGAYIAALNGVDVIVFTGGIGENSPDIRALITQNFSYLRIAIHAEKNRKNALFFSADHSPIHLMNIPANEEKVIAQQTFQVLTQKT